MENIDKKINDIILKNKPKLSSGSVKTYISILKNLYYNINEPGTKFNPEFFEDSKKILEYLKDKPSQNRKTILAAIITFNGNDNKNNENFRDLMNDDADEAHNEDLKQKKNDKQKENWVSEDDIKNKYNELNIKLNKILKIKKDEELTPYEYQLFQNIIILALMSGIYIPPRRLEYIDMKIKNYNKKTDNYKIGDELYFNKYKSAKFYGEQIVKLPKELNLLLNKFIKYNNKFIDTEYLLVDNNNNKLSNVQLNQRINKIFNKNVGVNGFRHSFITEKNSNIPQLAELMNEAKQMGHSLEKHLEYIKRD
jgi:hypothetical protein